MQDGYATLVPGIRIRDRTNNLCLSGGGGGLLGRRGRTHKHWGWCPRSSLEETFSRSRPWLCGRGEGSATKRPARRGYGGGVCSWMVAIDGCFPICTPPRSCLCSPPILRLRASIRPPVPCPVPCRNVVSSPTGPPKGGQDGGATRRWLDGNPEGPRVGDGQTD